MEQLNKQQLGATKSVIVYGELDDVRRKEAQQKGVKIGPISLQDLFILLSREENENATDFQYE